MKKTLALVLSLVFALGLVFGLTGCAVTPADNTDTGSTEDKTITVAATPSPHSEILEECKPLLAKEGYTLVIKTMDDYVIPNNATESGDVDANYFQHAPYLNSFNKDNHTNLVSVIAVHYEPLGLYAGKCTDLSAIEDGAEVAVPNDTTNEARALLLLEANGLIKLKENAGLTATKNDIVENPHNLQIKEMEASLIPTVRTDMALAVINGNYAIGAGLKVADALAREESDSEAAQTYANLLVVKAGNENDPKIKALAKALTDPSIKTFIENKYAGAVVAIF